MSKKQSLLTTCLVVALVSDVGAIKIGFGTALNGVQDTQSNGNNQMRQNINITDTVFLPQGTYRAASWEYNAGPDSSIQGVTQPVFPFLTIVNGPANHTVLVFGDTIDTEPGVQIGVPFGGADDTFTIPIGGATVAAGVQNTNATGVQNSILTDTSFGRTDHANGGNFDEAGGVGNTLDSFGHANLPRTYAFAIEVEEENLVDEDGDGLPANWEDGNGLNDNDDGTAGESAPGAGDGPNGALGDPDSDGLNNAGEFDRDTDPQDPDSDGDGVNDGSEVDGGTEPDNPDSDGDGLLDGVETGTGSFVDANDTGTDPLDADSDGDNVSDGLEVDENTDPNDAGSTPIIPGTVPTWNFGNNGDGTNQGWTVTSGHFANEGNGIEAAQANGNRAHDAAHPVAVLTSPTVNFSLLNVSPAGNVIDILWEGGRGNQNGSPDPADLAAVMDYNGGNTNNVGQKGLGFRNLNTGEYDFVSYDSTDGGGIQTASFTQADLVANGIDPNASYELDFFTTDDGGWGWTRLNEINLSIGAIGPGEPPTDDDNDTLRDQWEQGLTGNLTDLNGTAWDGNGVTPGPGEATGDFDGDGRSDSQEQDEGTDPTNADSDDDGLTDGEEATLGTNPRNSDSDSDGLTDGDELNTLATDPLNPDSDGDGRPDGDEVASGSNPNDPNSPGYITIGYGPELTGVTDTQSNGNNQMRQNINITDTVFLEAGTYQARSWNYNAAPDSGVAGVTQPVFPFLTIMNGPANHTVVAVGETIDTEPGIQWAVPFGGEEAVFTIPEGGATVAAGIQNTNALGVTNSIITNTSFGITDHANSGNVDEAGIIGNTLDSFGHASLPRTYGFSIEVSSGSGGDELKLAVDHSPLDSTMLRLTWASTPGKVYDVLINADLSSPRESWDGLADAQNIPADLSGTNTLDIALPFPGKGFVAIREKNAPPLFFDDLESGTGGWTTVVNDANGNTQWEFGTPNGSTGPIEGADGSATAWCTGLGDYFSDSDISLRSPAIDLTGVSGAELSFAAFRDADGFGDTAVVRFLRAVDNVQLGVDVAIDMSVFDTDYLTITIPVAAGALGETVLVEWNFVSDGSVDAFSGLSIDDVRVIAAAP